MNVQRGLAVSAAHPGQRQESMASVSCVRQTAHRGRHGIEFELLADREVGFKLPGAPPYFSAIPLQEVLAEAKGVGANSKAVFDEYMNLLAKLGNEFKVLMDAPPDDIRAQAPL